MAEYNITNVDYSLKTEIIDSEPMEFTNKVGVPHKEVTYVMAHVTFTYMLGHKVYEGYSLYPVVTVCTVVYTEVDNEIKATQFIKGDDIPSKATLDEMVDDAVSTTYVSVITSQISEEINKAYTAIMNKKLGYDSQYTEAPVSYPELDDWHTGPGRGAGEINGEDGRLSEWEYPVQVGNTLLITQAYLAKLNAIYHQLRIE